MKQTSINLLQDAWQMASIAHDGQKYGGATHNQYISYINHVGSVVFEIMHLFENEEIENKNLCLICAVLHDTLEDTEISKEQICSLFGNEIYYGVQALTKNKELPKSEQMQDSISRILEQPKEIAMVKMADRIVNLYHPPFYWNDEKIKAYQEEACYILENLKHASPFLANRLHEKIEKYSDYFNR